MNSLKSSIAIRIETGIREYRAEWYEAYAVALYGNVSLINIGGIKDGKNENKNKRP